MRPFLVGREEAGQVRLVCGTGSPRKKRASGS